MPFSPSKGDVVSVRLIEGGVASVPVILIEEGVVSVSVRITEASVPASLSKVR